MTAGVACCPGAACTGWGPGESWRAELSSCQKHPHLPTQARPAAPRGGRKWSAPGLLFLGDASVTAVQDHTPGTLGSCTDRYCLGGGGRGAQGLRGQAARAPAANLSNTEGSPLRRPNTPFVYSLNQLRSPLFLDPEHSTAPHCRQDSNSQTVISCASQSSPTPTSQPHGWLLRFLPPHMSPSLSQRLLSSSPLLPFSEWLMLHLLQEDFFDCPVCSP